MMIITWESGFSHVLDHVREMLERMLLAKCDPSGKSRKYVLWKELFSKIPATAGTPEFEVVGLRIEVSADGASRQKEGRR